MDSSAVSGSSVSNRMKDTAPPPNSANCSLKDTARQLHRSCGSLSGISGPVIVGRSISVDDWVPARPPKGAHLRSAVARPPSPEDGARTCGHRPSSPQSPSGHACPVTPATKNPEKSAGVHATNKISESIRTESQQRNVPRPSSPEPPPPPPSPPQQYSDEPLPPPPGPDELPPPPPSLPSRHPSPGPQVPTDPSESYRRTRSSSEFKIPPDPLPQYRTTKNIIANAENHYYSPEQIFESPSLSSDTRPHKPFEFSEFKNKSSEMLSQFSHRNVSSCPQKSVESLSSDDRPKSIGDHRNNRLANSLSQLPVETASNGETKKRPSTEELSEKPSQCCITSNQMKLSSGFDSQPIYNANKVELRDSITRSASEDQLVTTEKMDSINLEKNLTSVERGNPESGKVPTDKSLPDPEGHFDNPQYNNSAIEPNRDGITTRPPASEALSRPLSRDNLNRLKLKEKYINEKGHEEAVKLDGKKILRKTSFRCSERIQKSITSLQNSIHSSSPSALEEIHKDVSIRDNLLKDMLKDITAKENLTKDILSGDFASKETSANDNFTNEIGKEIISVDSLPKDIVSILSEDLLSKSLISNDKFQNTQKKSMTSKEVLSDEASKDICNENWSILHNEASASELTSNFTKLDHISLADKLLTNYSSQFSLECIDKNDKVTLDCDMDKSSSSVTSQLESIISVGSLQQKKEELVSRLSRKLSVLRAEAAAVSEETSANEELGEAVIQRVSAAWGAREASRLRSHVADLGRLTALLLTLTTRLARADNALLALSSTHPDKGTLETKRDRLAGQLEEARRLKEKVDRRNEAVTTKLRDRLNCDEYSDFVHFVSLKSKLLLDSREIADKIKLGEEQLQALQMTLSAVT